MATAIVTDGLCKMAIFVDRVRNQNFSWWELGLQYYFIQGDLGVIIDEKLTFEDTYEVK